MRFSQIFAALVGAVALAAPVAVLAQPAQQAAPPSYAHASADETIHGRVSAFDGGFRLDVLDDRGYTDTVQLHPGTIINPTGLRLRPGMAVTILGINRGKTFAANEIDTPYQSYGDVPVYAPGYYGYDPRFELGIGFGGYGHHWH